VREFVRLPLTISDVHIQERTPDNGHYYEPVDPRLPTTYRLPG